MSAVPCQQTPTSVEYCALRDSVGWPSIDNAVAQAALGRSLYLSHIRRDGLLVAFGRAVGDQHLFVYMQDIMVHPTWQRRGLGSRIMHDLLAQVFSYLAPTGYCGLLAVAGAEGFYEKLGFEPQMPLHTSMMIKKLRKDSV